MIEWRSTKRPCWNSYSPTNNVHMVAASPLTCLKDHPRKGEKLTLSPSGTLAAITDSLGRILLLDTQALIVVRLWKVCSQYIPLHIIFLIKKKLILGT